MAKDLDTIKTDLKEYLKNNSKFTDYDFDGSTLSQIVDLLAYNTFENSMNASLYSSELFLDTAQIRGNVVQHARQLGYVPSSSKSAKAKVQLTINYSSHESNLPEVMILNPNTKFHATINNKTYEFYNIDDYNAPRKNGKYVFENIEIVEGKNKEIKYIIDDISKQYEITDKNIDLDSLQVIVDGSKFTDSRKANKNKKTFYIKEGFNGNYLIQFGDGKISNNVNLGNSLIIKYRSSNSILANGIQTFILADEDFHPAAISADSITTKTITPAAGGAERESISSIKLNAPITYIAQNRAVSSDDYVAIIKSNFNNVESVSVWGGEENNPPQYGQVFVSIKPKGNKEKLTDTEKNDILSILNQKKILSIIPVLTDPELTYITGSITYRFNPNNTSSTISEMNNKIKAKIHTWDNDNLKRFNGVFRLSQILSLVDNSDDGILNSYFDVKLVKKFIPNNTKNITSYSFNYNTNLSQFGEILTSSSFIYNGVSCILKSQQVNNKTIINIFDIENKIIIAQNIGDINIDTGIVNINSIKFDKWDGDSIRLFVKSDKYDISPKRNNILSIDFNDLKINGEIDTITQGVNDAGVGYKPIN